MEKGVTAWLMSRIRTAGSMLYMTCLQIATESSSRPKSVMKAIWLGLPELPGLAENSSCEQSNKEKKSKHFRMNISTSWQQPAAEGLYPWRQGPRRGGTSPLRAGGE